MPSQADEKSRQESEKKFRGDLPNTTPPKFNACRQHSNPLCIVPQAERNHEAFNREGETHMQCANCEDHSDACPQDPNGKQGTELVKVLLIADAPDRIQLVTSGLTGATSREFQLSVDGCMGDANRRLIESRHDIVLLDLFNAQERKCRQPQVVSHFRRLHSDIPVVVLSDASASEAIVRGAQDCIPTDQLEPASLQRIIKNAVLRHDLSEQLRHANRLLDRRSGELRRANELLRQKNGRLKRLYDTAQEFVDHVSHEFRTPLTVIKEYAAILADGLVGSVSSKQREFLEIIDSRTDDLAYLIDDLLDVSRVRAGIIGVHRQDCTATDIFERVRSILSPRAAKRGITLAFHIQDTLPRVYCDPEKIGRVIVNLVVNAMKVCDDGKTVEVWAKAGDRAGEIVLGVTDEGPGIAPEDRERIFERFRQLRNNAADRLEGFGLGLSIVRDLVAIHFGELGVESTLGQGSTFQFSLPCSNMKGLVTRYLASLERLEESPVSVSVLSLQTTPAVEKGRTEELDRFLQSQMRRHDFVLRVAADKWIVFVQCGDSEVSQVTRRWREAWLKSNEDTRDTDLPDFELQRRGTWTVPDNSAELVQQLRPDYLTSARSTNKSCVLVVDDDRDFTNGLHLQLGAAGYAAKTAKDAETALRMATQLHPRAILLDNALPGMNGIEALEELKRNPITQDIPVIMLSANTKLQQAALASDAKFFLEKPCGFDKIVSALRNVLA